MKRTGGFITDDEGRILIIRGVNLGGSSKIPCPVKGAGLDGLKPDSDTEAGDAAAGNRDKPLSFAGRPFPIEEADDHFGKLKSWGFTFIRLVVTWEAIEHEGPGVYDESYLAYLRKLLIAAEKKGISVLVDPHQDVWSRFTGGDGAPAWTLEKLGIDIDKLAACGAALPQNGVSGKSMKWPVNYSLYGAATMFSLFFGGSAYAPEVKIEGECAQDFLQERYIAAFRHCFRRLKNCKAIAGWGTMNEPHPGFIGCADLNALENAVLALGPVPSPFQAMAAASGFPVKVPVYTPWINGRKITGSQTINPYGLNLFRKGFSCPWKQAGIWTEAEGKPVLLKPDWFSKYRGRPLRFSDDFLKPFMLKFTERMKEAERPVLFFIEGIPHRETPSWGKDDPAETVNAFHHYDGLTLFTKHFRPYFTVDVARGKIILGRKKTAALYSAKLAEARKWSAENMNNMPCFLGEFGLPFDLNNKTARKTGNYGVHEDALSLYYDGIDENLLGSAIWNYTADNNHRDGDHWNGEDLSIVSEGEPRAAGGWLRPYPAAVAGIPVKFSWNRKKGVFYFRFRTDPKIESPTEIFLPLPIFGENPKAEINIPSERGGGEKPRTVYNTEEQRLFVYSDGYDGEMEISVRKT